MEEALIQLVKSGVPLAKYAITLHYLYYTLVLVIGWGSGIFMFLKLLKAIKDGNV